MALIQVCVEDVGPRFFETLGIPVRFGRDFRAADIAREPNRFARFDINADQTVPPGPPVGILSVNLGKRLFGNANAVGRTIRNGNDAVEIVGIVENTRHGTLVDPPPEILYRFGLPNAYASTYMLRAAAVSPLRPVVESALDEIDATYHTTDFQTVRETVEATYRRERFTARLVGALGIVALSLVAIGFYGLLAYGVAERRVRSGCGWRWGRTRGTSSVCSSVKRERFSPRESLAVSR